MFIAKDEEHEQIIRGPAVNSQWVSQSEQTCVKCGKAVDYQPLPEHELDYFPHEDGSPDCFASDAMSCQHQLAEEVTVETIFNRVAEVTGGPVEIDTERRIGTENEFVISDVRVSSPLRIAAEVFFKSSRLSLKRRFDKLSDNGYQCFLVFHLGGTHDVDRIQRYMQRISPLRVGHFDPDTMTVNLGGLFSEDKINFSAGEQVPDYMVHTL